MTCVLAVASFLLHPRFNISIHQVAVVVVVAVIMQMMLVVVAMR